MLLNDMLSPEQAITYIVALIAVFMVVGMYNGTFNEPETMVPELQAPAHVVHPEVLPVTPPLVATHVKEVDDVHLVHDKFPVRYHAFIPQQSDRRDAYDDAL